MARTVDEIMNRELFSVQGTEPCLETLRYITMLGITGASVLDGDGRPIGMTSLRDLVQAEGKTVADCMASPVVTVPQTATIDQAARQLAESGKHRLVVVDEDGRAVGMVAALDVIRGLLGMPAAHPAAFPHYDKRTGLTWTDDQELDAERIEVAPDGPGLVVLVHGGAGLPERVVWAEACHNVRTRLAEMLAIPQSNPPMLAHALRSGKLRFRAAAAYDPALRQRALEAVQGEAMAALRPSPRGTA